MTRRMLRYWPVWLSVVVIVAATTVFGVAVTQRTRTIDELLFNQCISNEIQDAVIVAQLEAAKRRARASLPKGSAELRYQMQILEDGINALEPPDEPECKPPKGG